MERPTLGEQIAVSKVSENDILKVLLPQTVFGWINFWLCIHCTFIWRILHWNWFNIYTGDRGFLKFARHGFREWRITE